MDYFESAFGSYNPDVDPNFAVKFILNCMLSEDRLKELNYLLLDGHEVGGVEGEPGWIVERQDTERDGSITAYDDWPEGATFRAYVEPHSFKLGYPQNFLSTQEFHEYVRKALVSYVAKKSSKGPIVEEIISLLRRCP